MSIRTPSSSAARAGVCLRGSAALTGCLAGLCISSAHAASLDQHPRVDDDGDGIVTLSGLTETKSTSLPLGRRSNLARKGETHRPGLLPARMELSRTRWNGGAPGSVGVDRLDYRVSYGTASSAVSVGVGTLNYSVQQLPAGLRAGPLTTGGMASVSVAYRQRFDDKVHFNMEATRGSNAWSQQFQDSLVTTRVGVEYTPARNSVFGVERGSLALNMGSSGSFAMKIRRGGPMFYMKSKF